MKTRSRAYWLLILVLALCPSTASAEMLNVSGQMHEILYRDLPMTVGKTETVTLSEGYSFMMNNFDAVNRTVLLNVYYEGCQIKSFILKEGYGLSMAAFTDGARVPSLGIRLININADSTANVNVTQVSIYYDGLVSIWIPGYSCVTPEPTPTPVPTPEPTPIITPEPTPTATPHDDDDDDNDNDDGDDCDDNDCKIDKKECKELKGKDKKDCERDLKGHKKECKKDLKEHKKELKEQEQEHKKELKEERKKG